MTEETTNIETSAEEATPTSNKELKHIYYEIESDLLSKPNALVDIVLINPASTVIFCNQPSEADLVDVILKKRGVECSKLIGHVPHSKIASDTEKAVNGELAVLIVTDVSAKDLEVEKFSRLINYSIHEDPEIYVHRTTVSSEGSSLETVVNLVSPLDHGNFHYLKKVVDFDIALLELPSGEEIQKAQFNQIITEAEACDYSEVEEKLAILLDQLNSSDKKDALIKYLLYSFNYVMPDLRVKNHSRGNNRDEGSNSKRRTSYKDRVDGKDLNDEESRILTRNLPKKEYVRFYAGVEGEGKVEQKEITKLMKEVANVEETQIERFTERGSYAFIDLLKENSSGLVELLDSSKLDNGSTVIFKKATSIVTTVKPEEMKKEAAKTEEKKEEKKEEATQAEA